MPLTWDTTKVKYFQNNKDELWVKYNEGTPDEYEDVNAETKSLIFISMAIGIGHFTISNAADVYARIKVLEKYRDLYLYKEFDELAQPKNVYVTADIIKKHIGIGMNVGYENKKEWINRTHKSLSNDKYIETKPTVTEITRVYNNAVADFEDTF